MTVLRPHDVELEGRRMDADVADDVVRSLADALECPSGAIDVDARGEAVAPRHALDLFLTRPAEPGGRARRVEIQAPADLVLLDRPLRAALMEPSSDWS